jgi:hypothetical protein
MHRLPKVGVYELSKAQIRQYETQQISQIMRVARDNHIPINTRQERANFDNEILEILPNASISHIHWALRYLIEKYFYSNGKPKAKYVKEYIR